jgi:hypothetical protein
MKTKLRTYSDIELANLKSNILLSEDSKTLADEGFDKAETLVVKLIN